ncbi:MAG: LacI family DNA-binding transcriptional regulator [Bacillota bacterium]|nr:LacI family DNA-binding transcriptional regulator [Bacillota bacterium]
MRNATLVQVAEQAKVSPSTVSRYLNRGSVSRESCQRIEAAIKDLNYQPNAIARSLRGSKTYTVGFVIPDISNPFFTEIIKATGTILKEKGYSIMIYSVLEDLKLERIYIKNIMERRIDGLFITSTSDTFAREYETIDENIPVIQLDRVISPIISSVRTDNKTGAMQAVSHLLNQGRRHIAMIAGPQQYTPGRERYEGYLKALSLFNIPADERLIGFGDFSRESGYRCMMTIMETDAAIDAVFVGNNFMGVGAIQALRHLGKNIPDDLALIMFDDMNLADMTDPPITVVEQNHGEIGRAIASLFLQRTEGEICNTAREMVIPPRLIIRKSG